MCEKIRKPYFFKPKPLSLSLSFISHESLKTSHHTSKKKDATSLSLRIFSRARLLLKCAIGTVHLTSLHFRHFHNHPHLFSTNPEKPTSTIHRLSLKKSGFCFFSPFMFSRTGICQNFSFISSKYHCFSPIYCIFLFFLFFNIVCSSFEVHLQQHGDEKTVMDRLAVLKMKLEKEGIACDSCKPGQNKMICPQVLVITE